MIILRNFQNWPKFLVSYKKILIYKKELIRNGRPDFSKFKKQPVRELKAKKLLQYSVLISYYAKQNNQYFLNFSRPRYTVKAILSPLSNKPPL